MSKLVLILSTFGLIILITMGLVDPNNPMMWLASTSANFTVLRIFLVAVLLGLLFTHPPRNVYFRIFVGTLSVTLLGWALLTTYENHMKLVDSMSLMAVSIAAGLTVLEREEAEEKLVFPRYEVVRSRRPAGWVKS